MENICCAINLYEIRNKQSNALCVSVDLWPTTNLTHGNFIHLHISFESKRKSILGTSTCLAQCQQILSAQSVLGEGER